MPVITRCSPYGMSALSTGIYYGVIFVDTAVPFLKFYLAFVAELLRTARTTSNIDSFKGLSKKLIPRKLTNL